MNDPQNQGEYKPECPNYPNKRCCLLEPEEQIKYNCPYLLGEDE